MLCLRNRKLIHTAFHICLTEKLITQQVTLIPTKLAYEHLNKIPIDANMKEIDYYIDARVKQFAKDYAVSLAKHFRTVIHDKYNDSFDLYKSRRLAYAKLLEEAKKKNFSKLDRETLTKMKKFRKEFTSRFALPKPLKLSVYDKETKKMARVPLKALKQHVSKHFRNLFKIKRHGRDKYSGWQFKDYYVVDYNRIDELKKLAEEKKEESNMTKAEEKAIYDKAANGQLGCTPEYVIKQIKKKERSQKRRQETVAKKAVQASFEEFAKLKAENEQLKAEIAKLKQLKDLNSDIPSESIENSELEKLKADAAMWRKIDSDPFACEQHYNEVLSRMQPVEDEEEDIVVDQAMQAQLDQIRQLQSKINYGYNYDKIIDDFCKAASAPDFVRDGSDIPDVPPEPAIVKQPVDDIPTDEEQKEDKAKLLSFKLQEFLDKKYLQLSEAETLKKYSIYSSEIPALEDKKHVNLDDTDSRWQQRATIARYIQKHMHEFNIDNWNENKYPKNWAVKVLKNEDFMKKKARLS